MEEKVMKQILRQSLRHAAYMAEEQDRLRQLKVDLESISLGNGMGEGGGGQLSDRVGSAVLRRERICTKIEDCEAQIIRHGEEMAEVHQMLFDILTEEERRVMIARYSGDSWEMVRRRVHLSRSSMFRVHNRAMGKLCRYWEARAES